MYEINFILIKIMIYTIQYKILLNVLKNVYNVLYLDIKLTYQKCL